MTLQQQKLELIQKIIDAHFTKEEMQEVTAKAKSIVDHRTVNHIDNQNKGSE